MDLGCKPTGEAQGDPDLFCGVILCKVLANEVKQRVGWHIFKDQIFLEGCIVYFLEIDYCPTSRCKDRSSADAFRCPHGAFQGLSIVWQAARSISIILLTCPIDYVKVIA